MGEDLVLSRYMDLSAPGVYVDVGAHRPFAGSNTALLYSLGWRGLTIEANEDLCREFRTLRPLDDVVNEVISDEEGPIEFLVSSQSELSTVSSRFAEEWIPKEKEDRRIVLQAKRLGSLLEEHRVPYDFEFLSIDVEGHDFEVLRSVDLTKFRPSLILIEIHELDLMCVTESPLVVYLQEHGYRLDAYNGMNGFFVKDCHESLGGQP